MHPVPVDNIGKFMVTKLHLQIDFKQKANSWHQDLM